MNRLSSLLRILLLCVLPAVETVGAGLQDAAQPVLPVMNGKIGDIDFHAKGDRAWFNLPDLFGEHVQEQNPIKGILQLELDTETGTITATAATPEPSATLPKVIVYPSEPAWPHSPKASGIPELDETPILLRINDRTLSLVSNALRTPCSSDSTGVQYRTRYEPSVTRIPEETTTPVINPASKLDCDRICTVFEDNPFPEPYGIYNTDEIRNKLNIEVRFESGETLTISPSPTASSEYQSATLSHGPRQVSNTEAGTSAEASSPTPAPTSESGQGKEPAATNGPEQIESSSVLKKRPSTADDKREEETGQPRVSTAKRKKLKRPKWLPKDDVDKVCAEYLKDFPDSIPLCAMPEIRELIHAIREMDSRIDRLIGDKVQLQKENIALGKQWWELEKNKGWVLEHTRIREFNTVEKRMRDHSERIADIQKKRLEFLFEWYKISKKLDEILKRYITAHCSSEGCDTKLHWNKDGYKDEEWEFDDGTGDHPRYFYKCPKCKKLHGFIRESGRPDQFIDHWPELY